MKDWIKMSERKPTEADLPVWVAGDPDEIDMDICTTLPVGPCVTHWMKADIPAPPADPTQREKDADAYEMAYGAHPGINTAFAGKLWYNGLRAWHAALAYERAEVLKLLKESGGGDYGVFQFSEQIRTRCTP